MTEHFESSLVRAGLTCKATRAASVKASLTPRFRIAEHSGIPVSHDAVPMAISATYQDISKLRFFWQRPSLHYIELEVSRVQHFPRCPLSRALLVDRISVRTTRS